MPGVKGKSGGARPNTGGKRAGAGRKPKAAAVIAVAAAETDKISPLAGTAKDLPESPAGFEGVADPLVFLRMAWTGQIDASPTQVRAAASALPFVHTRLGEGGKKEQRAQEAKKVAGRFSAATPPKLVAAGGRKV